MGELVNIIADTKLETVQKLLINNVEKKSDVYVSMTKMMMRMWYFAFKPGGVSLLDESPVPTYARFLLPVVAKHSSVIASMVKLTKAVHAVRYNDMIIGAAKNIEDSHPRCSIDMILHAAAILETSSLN
jgi:hypothetical protein